MGHDHPYATQWMQMSHEAVLLDSLDSATVPNGSTTAVATARDQSTDALTVTLIVAGWLLARGVLELVLGVTQTQQGVAHFAHLGGMLGGYLTIRAWRSRISLR